MAAGQVTSIEDDAQYRVNMVIAAHGDASLDDNASVVSQAQHQLNDLTVYGHALDARIDELTGLLRRLQEEREHTAHLTNALNEVIHRGNRETQEIDRHDVHRSMTMIVPNDPSMVRY